MVLMLVCVCKDMVARHVFVAICGCDFDALGIYGGSSEKCAVPAREDENVFSLIYYLVEFR